MKTQILILLIYSVGFRNFEIVSKYCFVFSKFRNIFSKIKFSKNKFSKFRKFESISSNLKKTTIFLNKFLNQKIETYSLEKHFYS